MDPLISVLILGVILVFFLRSANGIGGKSEAKRAAKSITKRRDFISDVIYVSSFDRKGLAIDSTNDQILFSYKKHHKIMPFMSLIAVEVLEDGASVTESNRGSQLMGAAIGGALLGEVGAIIGGLSGSSRTNDQVKKVTLRVATDDLDHPNFDILFLDASNNSKGLEKTKPAYQGAIKNAAAWHSRIAAILKRLPEDEAGQELTVIESQSISVADEIGKLALLRDEGLLTDEEFTAQKASLLAN